MTNIKKNFIWNLFGSTAFSFTSLIFMIIVTRINGVEEAGIFTFAFSIACLFQVICNYFGRTFQVTNIDNCFFDSDFLFHRILTCFIMIVVVFVYLMIQDYSNYKNLIIILFVIYRIIESFSEILYATIQKNNELYKVGISLFLKAIFGILIFGIVDYYSKNVVFSIIGLNIITCFITVLYDWKNFKQHCVFSKFNKLKIKKIFIAGFFIFFFTFLTQYLLNAPKYAIDDLLSDEMQTIYGIISMPATFMILCSQLVIQPFLGILTNNLKEKKYNQFMKIIWKIIFGIFILGILTECLCYFVGIPVLELIYGIDLSHYLNHLLFIIAGAMFFGISYVASTALTTLRKTFVQASIYLIVSIIITIISRELVSKLAVLGATISYFIAMILLGITFVITLKIFIKRKMEE